jgi:hypothetical protein
MNITDLVFLGIKGSVVALDRASGRQVWATQLKGLDFVNVVLQNDTLLATCCGEIFCLEPLTGEGLWHNPLKGFGRGLATIAVQDPMGSANALLMAEKGHRDDQASAAAAVTSE